MKIIAAAVGLTLLYGCTQGKTDVCYVRSQYDRSQCALSASDLGDPVVARGDQEPLRSVMRKARAGKPIRIGLDGRVASTAAQAQLSAWWQAKFPDGRMVVETASMAAADLIVIDANLASRDAYKFEALLRSARSSGAAVIVLETIDREGKGESEAYARIAELEGATYLSQAKALGGAIERRDVAPSDLLTLDGQPTDADGKIVGRLVTDQLQAALNASTV